jgi:ATP-dependent Lon protease
MELLQLIHDLVPDGDEVAVHLITQSDAESCVKQAENLDQIAGSFTGSRVVFSWELDHNPNFHARSITTDTGWKITIDRGLDIFQKFESGPFSVEQAIQEARLTRGAEISYVRI